MPRCSECGETTLFNGVCVDCSEKRFDKYPQLKSKLDKIKGTLERYDDNEPDDWTKDDLKEFLKTIADITWGKQD